MERWRNTSWWFWMLNLTGTMFCRFQFWALSPSATMFETRFYYYTLNYGDLSCFDQDVFRIICCRYVVYMLESVKHWGDIFCVQSETFICLWFSVERVRIFDGYVIKDVTSKLSLSDKLLVVALQLNEFGHVCNKLRNDNTWDQSSWLKSSVC